MILLLNGLTPNSDEEKRLLFVAIIRAKSNLSIHYNGTYLDKISTENFTYRCDDNPYNEVQQVALLLNHKDVQLDQFKYAQRRINELQSGDAFTLLKDGLGNSKKEQVVRYSQKFKETLEGWKNKGFTIKKARVNFIVYWKDEERNGG